MKGIIYKATNTFNGKVYIGQTVAGLPKRKKQHIKDAKADESNLFHFALYQYPNGFTWDIVDTFEGDRESVIHALNVAEEYHILKCNSTDERFGYNSTQGGYSSDKFAEHIRKRAQAIGGDAKPILQYDEDGNFIQEFPSINAVAAHLGKEKLQLKVISDGLHYGYQWRAKKNEYFQNKIAPYKRVLRSSGKMVAVYDADGKLHGTYKSYADAERDTGISAYIRGEVSDITILERNRKPFYFFRCEDGNPPETISVSIIQKKQRERGAISEAKRIAVYSESGELIDICESQRATTVKYGSSAETIRLWCKRTPPFTIPACNKGIRRFFQVADGNEPKSIQINIKKTRDKYEFKMEHRIIQYTLEGDFVKVWDNAHQAAESGTETAAIIRKQTFGQENKKTPNFQWRFYSQDFPQRIAPYGTKEGATKKAERKTSPRMPDTIEELDWTGEVIATYKDTADAAEKSGVSQSYICNVITGRIKHPKRRFRRVEKQIP